MKTGVMTASWCERGKNIVKNFPVDRGAEYGKLTVVSSWKKLVHGRILDVKVKSQEIITFSSLSVNIDINLENSAVMSNGYQSWTRSREAEHGERMKKLNPIVRNLLKPYGDYGFYRHRGNLHSWTYTYVKRGSSVMLVGSCSEKYGYTVFDADFRKNSITLVKDCEGFEFSGECNIMSIYFGDGGEGDVWDEYCSSIPAYRKPSSKCTGWTSWYNYYTKISEDIILDNLRALSSRKVPIDVFQIDDGYQNAVGDWLEVNDKFPSGMRKVSEEISGRGYKPGLWLAPFVCEKKSNIFKNHQEWLLRDGSGNLVKAGWNPGWSGTFYSLNFYNVGFRRYLEEVFDTVFNYWGFRLVKLDFLYGVCTIPYNGKSRGQIMTEAMEFIRNLAGDNLILGCGVPLGPAFGRVDYCRIGSDVAPYWEDRKLSFANYMERVSTVNSLYSTIGRSQLNGRVFHNDPDVFILRSENNKMNEKEKNTLFILNNILGNLIFFSDNVDDYNEEEMSRLRSMYPKVSPIIKGIYGDNSLYRIEALNNGLDYVIYSNLGNKAVEFTADETYYSIDRFVVKKDDRVSIEPHETVVLCKINDGTCPYIIGCKGHIVPGSQIESMGMDKDSIQIEFHGECSEDTEVYVCIGEERKGFVVNEEWLDAVNIDGYNCVIVRKL